MAEYPHWDDLFEATPKAYEDLQEQRIADLKQRIADLQAELAKLEKHKDGRSHPTTPGRNQCGGH